MPPNTLKRAGKYVVYVSASICGAAQVHLHGTTLGHSAGTPEPPLPQTQYTTEQRPEAPHIREGRLQ